MTMSLAQTVAGDDPAPGHPAAMSSLDPADWPAYRALAHKMLDEAMGLIEGVRDKPVWQPMPERAKQALAEPLPTIGQGAEKTAADAARLILPYATGNISPRFFGWVHGSGTAGGVIAEMLAAAMNANAGGRDHGAIHVERQVIDWCRGLFGFPAGASGLLVSGTSMATLIALTVARNQVLGPDARRLGLAASGKPLVAYTSTEAHSSVARAFEMLGLGTDSLHPLAVDKEFRMVPDELRKRIRADKAAGKLPFAVIATAGTVNTGAIDPLAEIADICAAEGVWLHVDGAFGALLMLSDTLRRQLAGIERADSLAFDFHKWLHVPYDAGCVLVRDGAAHRAAFASRPTYLASHARGLAAGEPWPCDFGPELSRGFRALKVWFALKEHGAQGFGAAIEDNCRLARRLGKRVAAEPQLELLAPVTLNIACFRMRADGLTPDQLDHLNEDIVAELQERGIAAPSTTRIGGKLTIRVNITNHRTRDADIAQLLASVLEIGRELRAIAPLALSVAAPEVAKRLPSKCLTALSAALERPEIAAVRDALPVTLDASLAGLMRLSDVGVLRLNPAALTNEIAAAVLIRHGAELALWREHSAKPYAPDRIAAHALLAARTTGRYLALLSAPERAAAESGLPAWLLNAYRQLAQPFAAADLAGLMGPHNDLIERLLAFTDCQPEFLRSARVSTTLRVDAVNLFARTMELAVPVEHLITNGGDARIKPDPRTGRNGYGSSARPVIREIGFASSTATCVSDAAYQSVESLRRRLIAGSTDETIGNAVAAELERIRAAVALYSGAAIVPGTSVVLTASGTDAELATLALALARDPRSLTSIVISPEETGSGVPLATLGRHFSTETALGATVTSGSAIAGLAGERVQSVCIAIRETDGQPRPLDAVSAEVSAAVEAAVSTGRRVLLHVLDAAKTGIGAPALSDVLALTARHGDAIDVVVDACQARLGPDAVAAYLTRGWLVQMTGSKFWGGPPFSGALLVPASFRGRQMALIPLLASLGTYMAQSEWPDGFAIARAALPDSTNLGLVSRWQAALAEADRQATVPELERIGLARKFSACVETLVLGHPELRPVVGEPIDRSAVCDGDRWSGVRTIIPVIATRRTTAGPRALTLDEAKLLHQALARDVSARFGGIDLSADERRLAAQPCHLGQPVKLGSTAALRICASSRTLLAMAEPGGIDELHRQLSTVLAKMRLLLRHFEALTP